MFRLHHWLNGKFAEMKYSIDALVSYHMKIEVVLRHILWPLC